MTTYPVSKNARLNTSPFVLWLSRSAKQLSVVIVLGLTASHGASAKILMLIDQDAQPIANAVVAIPLTTAPTINHKIAVMDQVNKQFVPRVLTITRGQQVVFPNSDDIRHHVYSFSAAKPFELKLFKGAVNAPIMFDKPGIVVLGCNIHDQMIGFIYVADNEQTFISDVNGQVTLPDTTTLINVWHPNLSTQNTKRESIDITQLSPSESNPALQLTLHLVAQENKADDSIKSASKFKRKYH